MFRPTNPENAAKIQKLEEMLSSISSGQMLEYKTLCAAAGCDVKGPYRYLLIAAQERAEKNLGCSFECVRGFGIKRLEPDDMPDVGLHALRRARRAAKRGKRRMERQNTNSLSDAARSRAIGYQAMLGAVVLIADGRMAKTIGAVADPGRAIPPQNILEMFRK